MRCCTEGSTGNLIGKSTVGSCQDPYDSLLLTHGFRD